MALIIMYKEEQPGSLGIPGFSVFRQSLVLFVTNRRLGATALADMATYFAFGALETFLPVYLTTLRFEAYQIGLIFAIQVLVIAITKPFFGRIADRVDKRIQIVGGLLITGGAVAAVPFCRDVCRVPGSKRSLRDWHFIFDGRDYRICGRCGQERKQIGSSMGALSSIMDIGQSSGPLITGVIVSMSGYSAGFLAGFVLAVGVILIFVVSVRD